MWTFKNIYLLLKIICHATKRKDYFYNEIKLNQKDIKVNRNKWAFVSFDLCAISSKPPLWQAGEPSGYGLMACIQIPTLMLTTEWSWASLHHEIFHLSSELKTLSSMVLAQDPEISLLNFIPKRIESRCSNKNLYMSIHRSIIHKSQKGETTQTFINWWMDEQNVLYPYCCCEVASVVSNSVQPHRWQPTRLPLPWDSPGNNTGGGCHFLLQCMKVKSESEVAQSCPTLGDPMDRRLPVSSIHGIFQARVLEWGAIAYCTISIPWNIIQWWEWVKHWHLLQRGWILEPRCQLKEPRHKKSHIVWLHL